ncbi:unnamed protein product [Spodoptera littoralis]|uniref:Uncharacterized protein n=1 Tax=Spodoptera littoralis TaxID=7109 RepID=A0A9P0MYD0_SPOLI|nr:unnamed protein product [Spodoptera littoralis]CAH1635792.1 unnamed protein product [Spodoptera littoralis]
MSNTCIWHPCEAEEELELTGSPLKLDLSLHTVLDDTMMTDEPQLWTKEEGSHGPISLEVARKIANLYNKNRDQVTMEDAVPLWILTNPVEESKPLLVTVQSDSTHFARGMVTYDGNTNQDDVDLDMLVEDYAKRD